MFAVLIFALAGLSASLASAQGNVTAKHTDQSIKYQGHEIGVSSACKYEDGSIAPGQPGCYNFGSQPCVASVTMGRRNDSSASFTFKGSAIYINSALNSLSPLYTVTLDGKAEDVDGFRDSPFYGCQPLFSRTGLDPGVDHTITLASKGASPQAGDMETDGGSNFALIDFTYTTEGSASAEGGAGVASSAPLYAALGSVFALGQALL
ncbi:hypothetical protein BKA70DRAFT_1429140 [Coprinopsis sp. MPI-PUGE-AT-0042]|nr:hypothetical protein BKA70DRAFT_1429140 [Coprinopsis sp. MPI-PUGE-AT-0042]